jgi:hypothetical protein
MADAKKANPVHKIDILGDEHKFVFSQYAFMQLETLTGENFLNPLTIPWSSRLLVSAIWGGLIQNYPKYDDLLDSGPTEKVRKILMNIGRELNTAEKSNEVMNFVLSRIVEAAIDLEDGVTGEEFLKRMNNKRLGIEEEEEEEKNVEPAEKTEEPAEDAG